MEEPVRRRQIRLATIVLIVAFVLWILLGAVGGRLGLDPRYAILSDLACIAALIWSTIVLIRAWRAGHN